ncbi:MAG: hypothetical protein V2J16_09290 [Thermoleophilia bacterium]|jgi:hypothetical protein|nr:hypothetical protein [Thermoleophilia bacterium]
MDEGKGAGWIVFAWIMLLIQGTMAIINGFIALYDANVIEELGGVYVAGDLTTWGWIAIVLGVLGIAAAFSVIKGGTFGIWFAILVASVSMIVQLFWIPIVPFWALTIIVIDILVIYNLAVYGKDFQQT